MADLGRREFKVGGVEYPLAANSDDLVTTDKAVYNILQFFKSVIITHMGDKFNIQATKANILDARNQLITEPIMQLVPYNPANFLEEVQYKFPLISAFRRDETYREETRVWFEVTYDLDVMYMLPPLTAQQMYHLDMFRSHVRNILLNRLELGYDPDYNNGELVFQTAGIQEIKFVKSRYLDLENPKNTKTFFPTILMTFQVKERKNEISGSFPELTGIDGEIDISDGYQPNNFNLIEFQIDT